MTRDRFGLLRHHDFRQLFVADTISQLGTQVTIIALPLVAVLALRADPLEVGVLAACETAAFLLVGLPAGAWVDRMRRRHVLIVGDIGRSLVLASIPIAWWAGVLTMPQLYLVGLLHGVLTVFFDVSYQSYLPHLVGREHLVEGNAKLEAVRGVNHIAGPTVAGLVIQVLSAPVTILVDALSFLGSALFLGFIRKREPRPERLPHAHLGREIMEGLRFVLGNRLLRAIAMCTGSSNFFAAITQAMTVVLLARTLRLPPAQIGVFFALSSAGGLVGAFAARRLADRWGQGPAIWKTIAFTAPFALLLPLAQAGWSVWLAALGGGVVWFGVVSYNIIQVSFRQRLTPERLLGRMNASMRFLVWGTLPLGSLAGGVLGRTLGVRQALWIGTVGALFAFLPTLLSPLRRLRELPTAPDEPHAAAPDEPHAAAPDEPHAAAPDEPHAAAPDGAVPGQRGAAQPAGTAMSAVPAAAGTPAAGTGVAGTQPERTGVPG